MTDTLSGSITLKRLKKGVNVVLSIETENAALYQGWNPSTGIPTPNFTNEANQPILAPKAVAGNGQTASITSGTWYYNNTMLVVTGTPDKNGFSKCSDARFAINTGNFKLRIIGNVASKGNTSNDIFRFVASGEAMNTSYETEATAELHLQEIGTSAAAIYVGGKCTLSKDEPTTELTAYLFISGALVDTGYNYKWYKESGEVLQDGNSRKYTAKRDDVTAIGGIYCSAYLASDSQEVIICTDFHKMTDLGDEYELSATVDKDWDGTNPQHVTAHLYKFVNGKKGDEVAMTANKVTHVFASSSNKKDLGTLVGNPVEVGTSIWGKIESDNEDVVDFISYEI